MMIWQKLLFVTILLLLLSYTGVHVYTSVCIFVITVVATYICYTLNTQLRLENYLKYLKYLKKLKTLFGRGILMSFIF